MNQIKIPMRPFPAIRVNAKWWRFTPSAIEYHNKSKQLRIMAHKDIGIIRKSLLTGKYNICFMFEIPKSRKDLEALSPHTQRPDIDNLFKAFTDSIFFWCEKDDWGIWYINAEKCYWTQDQIIFNYNI